jgi:hypothetical protein
MDWFGFCRKAKFLTFWCRPDNLTHKKAGNFFPASVEACLPDLCPVFGLDIHFIALFNSKGGIEWVEIGQRPVHPVFGG